MSSVQNPKRRTTKARRQTSLEVNHTMECEDTQETPAVTLVPETHTNPEASQDSHETSNTMDCSRAEESVSMQPGVTPGEGVGVSQSSSGSSANAGRLAPSQPLTPLERAAFDEKSSLAAKLVKKGANVNQPSGSRGETPLHTAAYYNNEKMAKILLKLGADPNIGDIDGLTPFDFVIMTGCPSMLQLFMKFGANPDSPDGARLIRAIKYSPPEHRLANVKSLVEKGACVNRADANGAPVFCYAVKTGSVPLVEYFLASGADVDGTVGSGRFTPLREAVLSSLLSLVIPLLDHGAAVDCIRCDADSMTPLCIAMLMDKSDIVELLLQRDADPNHKCFVGKDPIIVWAMEHNYKPVVELLLQRGFDPTATCANGASIAACAAYYNYGSVLEYLLQHGVDPNAEIVRGVPILVWTVERFFPNLVEILLKFGAKVEQPPEGLPSLLSWAVECECAPLVEDIMRNDPTIKLEETYNKSGNQVLHLAAGGGCLEIVKIFLAYNVDVNSRNKYSYTALMYAARHNHPDVVAILLENGADPNLKTAGGQTALYHSIQFGEGASVELLLRNGADANCMIEGTTLLHVAVQKRNSHAAGLLLVSGADATCLDKDGNTPGAVVVRARDLATMSVLLAHGVRADSKASKYGSATLIDDAVSNGHLDTVVLLLENQTTEETHLEKYLVYASSYGHLEIVKHLLNLEVHVDCSIEGYDGPGFTSLMAAAKSGDLPVVEFLVSFGADVNKVGAKQFTAFDYAVNYGHSTIAKYLLDHGTNIACMCDNGGYAVWRICLSHSGDMAILDRLLTTGAPVDKRGDQTGHTALMCAVRRFDLVTAQRLVAHHANTSAQNTRCQTVLDIAMDVYQQIHDSKCWSRDTQQAKTDDLKKGLAMIEYLKSVGALASMR